MLYSKKPTVSLLFTNCDEYSFWSTDHYMPGHELLPYTKTTNSLNYVV
jgi:hypothetical protein